LEYTANKLLIATEAGVFTTGLINGGSTQWFPSPGFPLVRTDMLKLRKSDNTVVAATHGRGMWSGNILEILPLRNITLTGVLENDNRVNLSWKIGGSGSQVKYFVQTSIDGINYQQIAELNSIFSYKHFLNTNGAYFRILATEPNAAPVFSNVVFIKSNKTIKGLQVKVSPNPLNSLGNLSISSSNTGNYNWQLCNVQGSILKTGNGNIQAGTTSVQPIEVSKLSPGMYIVKVLQGNEKQTTTFIKQ